MSVLMLAAGLYLAYYMGSCLIHPYMKCKACNRSKESHSTSFKGAFGACRSCRGRGHSVRFGARLMGRK